MRAEKTTYRVGVYQNSPLVFLDKAGTAQGLFPELLNAASQDKNWSLNYVPCQWAACLQQLKQGRLDLLAPVAFTPRRGQIYDFIQTTILSNWGQIFFPPRSHISSILDLDGKRVAVVAKDVYLENQGGLRDLARNFDLKINFIPVGNYRQALQAVADHRADAALVNRIFGVSQRESNLEPSTILINPVDVRVAFSKGKAPELRRELDAELKQWKHEQDSVYHRLVGKWLSPASHATLLPTWVVPLFVFLGILMLVLWLVILLTRRQMRQQTWRIAAKNRLLQKELRTRRKIEGELEERRQQYQVLFDENQSVMLLVDPQTMQIVEANPSASRFYGYPQSVLAGLSFSQISTTPREELRAGISDVLEGREQQVETVHRRADGQLCEVEVFSGPIVVGGRPLLCSVIHDISERLHFQQELTEKHRFLQTIIDGVSDPITVITPDYQILMRNQAATAWHAKQQQDKTWCYNLHHQTGKPCQGENHPCPLERIKQSGKAVTLIHQHQQGGETRILELSASPLWHRDGSLRAIIEVSRDITERRKAENLLRENEKRLDFLAHHDALTGLPNRLLFEDRLAHALTRAKRNSSEAALLFIDLDRFKHINDTLGHDTGDQLLVKVGQKLRAAVRESDTVARLGGDEFLILLEEIDSFKTVSSMAQRIRRELGSRTKVARHQLVTTGSIGISLFPRDAQNAEDLIQCADVAMYHAKGEGKNNYQFYTPHMNARAQELLFFEGDLHQALDEGQFQPYYQPLVELKTGRLIGVEALLRWIHPQKGLVPPADFIPLAEETGLIVPLGEWMLREACRQQVKWLQQGYPALRMAVNISSLQLKQPDFTETIDLILTESGIDARDLELEITESLIMRDVQSTIIELTDLRMRGIRLAIDDFGTGYSSLSYLNRFPVDQLKIDQSFVGQLREDMESGGIVDAVIALGHSMGLEVIAEGIESQRQRELLSARGCQLGQGFLFSPPLPEPELREKFLREIKGSETRKPAAYHFNFPEQKA